MRRLVALVRGLPSMESETWGPKHAPTPAPEPVRALRKVTPFEAMTLLKGA